MQYAQEDAVEGAHPEVLCPSFAHLPGYTLLHLTRRLVGERQRQDVPRVHALFHQVSYLIRQHTRLARARTRYHQRRPVTVEHGISLPLIQFVQEIQHIYLFLFSSSNKKRLASKPPAYPVSVPSAPITRWQGMKMLRAFAPLAAATALTAVGLPSLLASSP